MKKMTWLGLSIFGWTFWLPLLLTGVILVLTLALICPPLSWLMAVESITCLAFFRDPPRRIPTEPGLMVAPADGKITDITRLENHGICGSPALRIGIFLSVLDVHVNRSPCDATVGATEYRPGLFFDARRTEAATDNESLTITLLAPGTAHAGAKPAAVVRQISGAIARRIIAPVQIGQRLARGQRFGMIAFGSRTELIVPAPERWEVVVHAGQHVKAGATILLRHRV